MKTTPAEKHIITVLQGIALPKAFINENASTVGDVVDKKILKKIAREFLTNDNS